MHATIIQQSSNELTTCFCDSTLVITSFLHPLSVKTWSGDKNSIDSIKSSSQTHSRRRGRDDWDREIDRGKVRGLAVAYKVYLICVCVIMLGKEIKGTT